MNHQFWGSLVTALLISTAHGAVSSAPVQAEDQDSSSDKKVGIIDAGGNLAPAQPALEQNSALQSSAAPASINSPSGDSVAGVIASQPIAPASGTDETDDITAAKFPAHAPIAAFAMIDAQVPQPSALEGQKSEVTKVGTRQSQQADEQPADLVARIQPHTWEGRAAATLYVRDIPIVTFLTLNGSGTRPADRSDNTAQNPVWQATDVAARINALSRSDFDARSIALVWSEAQNQYQIRLDDQVLLGFAENVRLADATRNRSDDALQAANRLRRLLGNAPPLRQNVLGQARQNVLGQARNSGIGLAVRSFRVLASGIASWYGPGFHGNRSASGEVFNQNAMTAAHRSLPFGTRVRVVNRSNGRSVVVRITDRGPYARGRVIDLSTAAARVLGLVQSGVAPVRIEVLRR